MALPQETCFVESLSSLGTGLRPPVKSWLRSMKPTLSSPHECCTDEWRAEPGVLQQQVFDILRRGDKAGTGRSIAREKRSRHQALRQKRSRHQALRHSLRVPLLFPNVSPLERLSLHGVGPEMVPKIRGRMGITSRIFTPSVPRLQKRIQCDVPRISDRISRCLGEAPSLFAQFAVSAESLPDQYQVDQFLKLRSRYPVDFSTFRSFGS